jgi:hypothetical protein
LAAQVFAGTNVKQQEGLLFKEKEAKNFCLFGFCLSG